MLFPSANELKSLDEIIFIQEESSFWNISFMSCIGCLNLRPLKLHFMERSKDVYIGDRRYRLGGCCGYPLEMIIRKGETLIGKMTVHFFAYMEQNSLIAVVSVRSTPVYFLRENLSDS